VDDVEEICDEEIIKKRLTKSSAAFNRADRSALL
jgi:hypothetical protein